MSTSADRHPALYGVLGFGRGATGAAALGVAGSGRRARTVLVSESLSFDGPEGGTVTVISRRPGDELDFDRAQTWAPSGPYWASQVGETQAFREAPGPTHRPVEAEWAPTTVLVDGDAMRFEVCHLGAGYWGAIGRVADAIVTIDSRGVPLNAVQLERLSSSRPPPLDPPDIGERSQAVLRALDERFALLPLGRVHRFADYLALRTIEMEHVHRRASKEGLTRPQSAALEKYWLSRVEAPLGDQLDELQFKRMDALHRSRAVRRNQACGAPRGARSEFLAQLWSNTLGPGARTWFGNRYSVIRRYTFRVYWRP